MNGKHLVVGSILFVWLLVVSGCGSTTLDSPPPQEPSLTEVQGALDALSTPHTELTQQTDALRPVDALPIGFAVRRSCEKATPCLQGDEELTNGFQMILYSTIGQEIGRIRLPLMGEVVHIASELDLAKPDQVLFVFRNYETNEFQMISDGEVVETLDGSNVYRMLGAESQQVYTFSYLPGVDVKGEPGSGLSEILVSPEMKTVVTSSAPDLLVIPVKIFGTSDLLSGSENIELWYTYEPYGIGGGVIFPQYRGLYYLMGDGTDNLELLPDNLQYSGLSHDGGYVAYTLVPRGEMMVKDLRVYSEINFPLLESSNQGAGFAAFSPDSHRIAWMEAGGDLYDGSLETVVRIATVDGEILADLSADLIQEVFGLNNMIVYPLGWLDDERVLLHAGTSGKDSDNYLVVAKVDGTLEELLLEGKFIAFLYGE